MNDRQNDSIQGICGAIIGSLLVFALMKGGWVDLAILIGALIIGVGAVILFWVVVLGAVSGIEKLWNKLRSNR